MTSRRRTVPALIATSALLAAPLALAPAPAQAADREFRYAGAEVDYDVEKDDGRFEIDVDIDDARPGSRWKIKLWHDGKRYTKVIKRADDDGDIDIDRKRPNTRGKDVFKLRIKRVGGPRAKVVTITRR